MCSTTVPQPRPHCSVLSNHILQVCFRSLNRPPFAAAESCFAEKAFNWNSDFKVGFRKSSMKRMGRSKSLSENQVIMISLPDSCSLSVSFSLTHSPTHTHFLSLFNIALLVGYEFKHYSVKRWPLLQRQRLPLPVLTFLLQLVANYTNVVNYKACVTNSWSFGHKSD